MLQAFEPICDEHQSTTQLKLTPLKLDIKELKEGEKLDCEKKKSGGWWLRKKKSIASLTILPEVFWKI